MGTGAARRTIYRLQISLDAVLNLCEPTVWRLLSLQDAPSCFLDRTIARATARFIRTTTAAEGLIVPSMALLDQLDRWCLVVFLNKLSGDPSSFVRTSGAEGALEWPPPPRD